MASAISGFINQIRTAVYGEQVRGAIVSALEQCYSDVNAPSLQTEAFEAALNEAYAGGILDIQTVTSFADMTNDKIIYRYNGTAAGKQKGLYYYSALSNSWVLIGSEIQKVSLLSQMTDVNDIYKYIGTESGMVQNSLYCHNGTDWTPIGAGVLTADTAADMTNTSAIYRYDGNEEGYTANALYYYNGTNWAPVSYSESSGGLTDSIKTALLACFRNVAWTTEDGETLYDNLYEALYDTPVPTVVLCSDIANETSWLNRYNQLNTKINTAQSGLVPIVLIPVLDTTNKKTALSGHRIKEIKLYCVATGQITIGSIDISTAGTNVAPVLNNGSVHTIEQTGYNTFSVNLTLGEHETLGFFVSSDTSNAVPYIYVTGDTNPYDGMGFWTGNSFKTAAASNISLLGEVKGV